MVGPYFWMLSSSLKPSAEVMIYPPSLWPKIPRLDNYAQIFQAAPFGRYILNSAMMAGAATLISLLLNSLAGYAFAKLRFPGRDLLFLVLLSTLMISTEITVVPLFLIIRILGWVDTYQGLIAPGIAGAYGIFFFRQFFMTIPTDLLDAARIDGASWLGIYWHIMLPLSRPALATYSILAFVWVWDSFFWPLIITNSREMYTVQIGLASFIGQYRQLWNLVMAGSILSSLPNIVLFLFLQRYYLRGVAFSGLKG